MRVGTLVGAALVLGSVGAGLWTVSRASGAGVREDGAGLYRVALVGDSHAQVTWPLLRARLGGSVVFTRAEPGWSSARYASDPALPGQLAGARPDVVVLALGGNDRTTDPSAWAALVERAFASGARVVLWVGPARARADKAPDVAAWHERVAEAQRSWAASAGVPWLDSRSVTTTGHGPDGVHFDRAAYARWADAIAGELARIGVAR